MRKLLFSVLILGTQILSAQNQVGINQPNVDASAVFEMNSVSSGVLIPRMVSNDKDAIDNPAQGLIIFETSTREFWYFNGAGWIKMTSDNVQNDGIGDSDSDTRIFLDLTRDNDQINFYSGGVRYFRMNRKRFDVLNTGNSVFIGDSAGFNDDKVGNSNVLIGTSAGLNGINARRNVGVGYQALRGNVNDVDNIGIGNYAGRSGVSARRNISIGQGALLNNTIGDNMVAIGHHALESHNNRNSTAAIGNYALRNDVTGQNTLAIGTRALGSSTGIINGVAVGYQSGMQNTGNSSTYLGCEAGSSNSSGNRMYIDNQFSLTPLLFGNFASNALTLNGSVLITGDVDYVGTLTDISDRRLKSDIKPVTNTLDKLIHLNGYSYTLKSNKVKEFGLVAQEVESIFPTLVRKIYSDKEYIGVSYVQFIPLILEAEKELNAKLVQLDESNVELNNDLEQLELSLKNIRSAIQQRIVTTSTLSNID